ncbi:helix-turn-helix transcriptional regulator [Paenibacillus radicis (ex Xue et al. 2023)]|uniref:AraC family transcriptional regulator n=1 Tax=Paenibacillus radicis (ex Xue et al. 2023) TaxID=2972489 RepID=A0ABT1YFF3_9BACL|nr:AraC family transcriptional regulator [Paenibacillus radicis (ex Xue et al. 2023)]MCR8630958.1 AraC family transcriptional regulator [Paenibacillus radicis (ex Xue et al. 2023)]
MHAHAAAFHHNFNHFFDQLEPLTNHREDLSRDITIQHPAGTGLIHRLQPRPEMELVLSDFRLTSDRTVELFSLEPMVEFGYCFQGTRRSNLAASEQEIVPGQWSLQLINTAEARLEFDAKQPFMMLGIGMSVAVFHDYLTEAAGGRSIDFAELLGAKPYRIFQETIDPAVAVILKHLVGGLQSRDLHRIELECRILELLLLAFRSFLVNSKETKPLLTRDEQSRIEAAREIMMVRMSEPPSLLQLSRLVGLNDYKLKVGFKEMYGNTVFGYLREKRLEQAWLLLQEGNANVNEVSCTVGYSNPSHFAEAFRKQYGVNPGALLRRSSSYPPSVSGGAGGLFPQAPLSTIIG